jgi:hypothetical protein
VEGGHGHGRADTSGHRRGAGAGPRLANGSDGRIPEHALRPAHSGRKAEVRPPNSRRLIHHTRREPAGGPKYIDDQLAMAQRLRRKMNCGRRARLFRQQLLFSGLTSIARRYRCRPSNKKKGSPEETLIRSVELRRNSVRAKPAPGMKTTTDTNPVPGSWRLKHPSVSGIFRRQKIRCSV